MPPVTDAQVKDAMRAAVAANAYATSYQIACDHGIAWLCSRCVERPVGGKKTNADTTDTSLKMYWVHDTCFVEIADGHLPVCDACYAAWLACHAAWPQKLQRLIENQ